jgi:GDP-D-mannose dehydratase
VGSPQQKNTLGRGGQRRERLRSRDRRAYRCCRLRYFRPTEVETLLGDPTKAKEKLGWTPKITLEQMVHEMMESDLNIAKRDELIKQHGYKAFDYNE